MRIKKIKFFLLLFIFCFIHHLKRLSWKMENGRRGRNWSVMQPQLMAYPQGNLQDLEKCRHNFPRQKEADWQVLLNRASAAACECLAVPPWLDVRAFTVDTDIQATGKLGHGYKYETCIDAPTEPNPSFLSARQCECKKRKARKRLCCKQLQSHSHHKLVRN